MTPLGFAQGPLTPPAAPAPTMKTLSQIEPRIPITNVPVTITQPGSYYLTTNIVYSGSNDGIRIATNNVTIEKMAPTMKADDKDKDKKEKKAPAKKSK